MTTPVTHGTTRDPAATDSPAAAAWSRLLERLKSAGEVITGPIGAIDGRERAEGFRHLTRLVSIGHEMLVEKGDPTRPAFTRWMRPWRKVFGDNPRTVYDAAIIDGRRTYVIRGQRGTSAYLGICLYATGEDGARRIAGNVDDTELTIRRDGAFELWLAPPDADVPAGADHLPCDPDVTDVMFRQYFVDHTREQEATYTIEAATDAGPPPPLTEDVIARRLDALGAWVHETVEVEATLSALSASATASVFRHGNEFVDGEGHHVEPSVDLAVIRKVMPTPSIQYAGQWFEDLGDDEALVVTGVAPRSRYWSIQLLSRWMESGDWEHHPVALTGHDVTVDANGRFRVVVAHTDPGVGNWLATTGLRSANLAVRALLAEKPLDVAFQRVALPLEG